MKKVILTTVILLGFVVEGWGQDMGTYKERHLVKLRGFEKDKELTMFKYVPKDSIVTDTLINVVYNQNGDTISYNKVKVKKAGEVRNLDFTTIVDVLKLPYCSQTKIFKKHYYTRTKANLSVNDDKVFIHPFIYIKEDAVVKKKNLEKRSKKINSIKVNNQNVDLRNEFFEKYHVYLELDDRQNYSFGYRAGQLGVVTIPVKFYMCRELGNVETDINAMISGGVKWGKTRFVKFPHEADARQYQNTWSFNLLAGVSKIKLDKSNTTDNATEGNIAAISTGVSFGVHYRNFTFLLATGIDNPIGNRKVWKFSQTPWIGIGFGYDFLKWVGKSN